MNLLPHPAELQPRLLEIHDTADLAEACREVLTNPDIDLGICRQATDGSWPIRNRHGKDAAHIFYDKIPELYEVDTVTEAWYREHGYSDYQIDPHLSGAAFRLNSIAIHADEYSGEAIAVGPTFSLGLRRQLLPGIYGAEKPAAATTRDPDTHALSEEAHEENMDLFRRSREGKKGVALRTEVKQNTGDLVFFANHPVSTVHGVRGTLPLFTRRAVVTGYYALAA